MALTISERDGRVVLTSPYHPAIPPAARALAGKWNATRKVWSFDARDLDRVRELCVTVYGIDPLAPAPADLLTVRVDLDRLDLADSLFALGRQLARRAGRDYAVRLGEGVVILAGGFPAHGGSVKYPRLAPLPGTVLEVRDVPRMAVENAPPAIRAALVEGE